MSGEPPAGDPEGRDDDASRAAGDPFEGLTLDESFVAGATVTERDAAARARAAAERAAREENLRRLLADETAQRANREQMRLRYAPGGGGGDPFGDHVWDEEGGRPRPRRRRWLRVVAVLVVAAVVGVYVLDRFPIGGAPPPPEVDPTENAARAPTSPSIASSEEPDVDVVRPENFPPAGVDAEEFPLGNPAAVPEGGGPHSFAMVQPDGVTPVGYDPCRPIRYVVRPGGPPEGDVLIREAVEQVSAATGLVFVEDGATDEAPAEDRAPYQPERYGERWAPVLFAWSDPAESPRLAGGVAEGQSTDPAGFAGSTAVGIDRGDGEAETVFVTGSVVLDGPDLTQVAQGPNGRALVRSVIAHEVAHLVGLGHVEDPAQLMFPTIQPGVTDFAPGDLEGLAQLGTLACFPEI